jgi:hypothetical protein
MQVDNATEEQPQKNTEKHRRTPQTNTDEHRREKYLSQGHGDFRKRLS